MRSVRLLVTSFIQVMNENRWMALLWTICLVGGVATGLYVLTEPFGVPRAILGGVLGGTGAGLFLSINRLIG
jgi:hypothetical protein